MKKIVKFMVEKDIADMFDLMADKNLLNQGEWIENKMADFIKYSLTHKNDDKLYSSKEVFNKL